MKNEKKKKSFFFLVFFWCLFLWFALLTCKKTSCLGRSSSKTCFLEAYQGISLVKPRAALMTSASESTPTSVCQAHLPFKLFWQFPFILHRTLLTALVSLPQTPRAALLLYWATGAQSTLWGYWPTVPVLWVYLSSTPGFVTVSFNPLSPHKSV